VTAIDTPATIDTPAVLVTPRPTVTPVDGLTVAAGPVQRWFTAANTTIAAMFGLLFALAISPALDPDLPWHLGTGRWIIENGSIPKVDPFSWSTPGRKWIAHEWLSEVIMFKGWQLGGWALLIVVAAAIITLAWFVLFRTCRVDPSVRAIPAAITTLLAALSTVHTWGVRPQMLTLLFVAVTCLRLHQWFRRAYNAHNPDTRATRVPWEIALLIALWANLHGGFIFGIVMVGVFAAGALGEKILHRWTWTRADRPVRTWREVAEIWALLTACFAASIATPNTIDGLIYPFTYLGDNASTRYVGEWFAPDFTRPQFWPFALFGLLLIVLMVVGRRYIGLTEIGLTLPFLALGVQSVRNISQATVCGAPVLAMLWSRMWTSHLDARATKRPKTTRTRTDKQVGPKQKAVIAASLAIPMVVALVAMTAKDLTNAHNTSERATVQPLKATQWLVDHPNETVLNHYNFGGWLIWNRVPVFIDGRPDMYGDTFVDEYVALTGTKGDWKAELDRLGVTTALLPKENQLAKALADDPDWSIEMTETAAVLFVRNKTRNGG
jgi:hypothetical protein